MSYNSKIFELLLISPSDVVAERDQIQKVVEEWNNEHARRRKVRVVVRRWEHDARSELGDDPQKLINNQIVHDSDMAIGVFWSKLGTPTTTAKSGSAEEIEIMANNNKPVAIFFSKKSYPNDVDIEGLAEIRKYKDSLRKLGVVFDFDSTAGLEKLSRQHITSMVDKLIDGVQNSAVPDSETADSAAKLHDRVIAEASAELRATEDDFEHDGEDDGIIDLGIAATEAIDRANELLEEIRLSIELVGEKTNQRVVELQGNVDKYRSDQKLAKKWVDGAASELNDFAYDVQDRLPELNKNYSTFLANHSRIVELMDEMPQPKSDIDSALDNGSQLIAAIEQASVANSSMITTISSLPPMTGKFKSAKSRVAGALSELNDLYSRLVSQTTDLLSLYQDLIDQEKFTEG